MPKKLAIPKILTLKMVLKWPNQPFQLSNFCLFWAFFKPKCNTDISLLITFSTILQELHKFQGITVILGVLQFPLNPRHFLPMKFFWWQLVLHPITRQTHACMHISTSNYHVSMYGTTIFGSYNSFINSIVQKFRYVNF